MNSQRQSELSALLDGELASHEAREVLRQLVRSDELRGTWDAYILIGDQLRNECLVPAAMTASVMARLRDEPVVLAQGNLRLERHPHPGLALAASLMGMAVVGWLAFTGNGGAPGETPERAALAAPVAAPLAAINGNGGEGAPARRDISEYLIAHHTQAANFRLSGSPEHVRSVAVPAGFGTK